jgi:hypothetical protein
MHIDLATTSATHQADLVARWLRPTQGRAERIASSITSGSLKASALSDIARALAAIDPGRAARLFTDAGRVANSIPDERSKPWALCKLAEAVAATSW